MSDHDDADRETRVDKMLNRRKVLSTATAATAATALGSSVVAAEEDDKLTETEVLREMADEPVLAAEPRSSDVSPDKVKFSPDTIPADADMLIGKYKSASVPGENPVRVESKREWAQREAPPGYEEEFSTDALDDLYLEYSFDTFSVGGVSINAGIGVGVQISSNVGNLDATASVDLTVNGYTLTVISASVGYGESGLCAKTPLPYLSKLGDVETCVDFTITNSPGEVCVEVSSSLNVCTLGGLACAGVSSPPISGCVTGL